MGLLHPGDPLGSMPVDHVHISCEWAVSLTEFNFHSGSSGFNPLPLQTVTHLWTLTSDWWPLWLISITQAMQGVRSPAENTPVMVTVRIDVDIEVKVDWWVLTFPIACHDDSLQCGYHHDFRLMKTEKANQWIFLCEKTM